MDTYKITTDDTLRETLPHGTARYPFAYYPENIWQFDFHRIDWHWHHEFEFLIAAESKICGFTSAGYFCRKFREYYHMSPGEYRQKKSST